MSDFTAATVPTIYGIDVTTSAISVSKLAGDATPQCRLVVAPSSWGRAHTVASSLHRQQTTTDDVVDYVLENNVRPHLVVMGKLGWNVMERDPSAPRRFGQWWDIAARLTELRVPVAEVPFGTATAWATGRGLPTTPEGLAAIKADLISRWSDLETGFKVDSRFRPAAALYAAFGAMVIGLETPYAATEERIKLMTMKHEWKKGIHAPTFVTNNSVQLPAAVRPVPKSRGGWDAKRARLAAAIPEPDATTVVDDEGAA